MGFAHGYLLAERYLATTAEFYANPPGNKPITQEQTAAMLKSVDMPTNTFYCHESAGLVLFLGKEPNLQWRTFGDCVLRIAEKIGISRILFIGSF